MGCLSHNCPIPHWSIIPTDHNWPTCNWNQTGGRWIRVGSYTCQKECCHVFQWLLRSGYRSRRPVRLTSLTCAHHYNRNSLSPYLSMTGLDSAEKEHGLIVRILETTNGKLIFSEKQSKFSAKRALCLSTLFMSPRSCHVYRHCSIFWLLW